MSEGAGPERIGDEPFAASPTWPSAPPARPPDADPGAPTVESRTDELPPPSIWEPPARRSSADPGVADAGFGTAAGDGGFAAPGAGAVPVPHGSPYPPPPGPGYPPPGAGYPPPGGWYPYGSPYGPYAYGAYAPPKNNGLAIAAMVCGICGFVLCQVFAIPALALGLIARKRIRESQGTQTGDAFALTGIVLGGIGIALLVLLILFYVGVFAFAFSGI